MAKVRTKQNGSLILNYEVGLGQKVRIFWGFHSSGIWWCESG